VRNGLPCGRLYSLKKNTQTQNKQRILMSAPSVVSLLPVLSDATLERLRKLGLTTEPVMESGVDFEGACFKYRNDTGDFLLCIAKEIGIEGVYDENDDWVNTDIFLRTNIYFLCDEENEYDFFDYISTHEDAMVNEALDELFPSGTESPESVDAFLESLRDEDRD
jgi:hypothetical protein